MLQCSQIQMTRGKPCITLKQHLPQQWLSSNKSWNSFTLWRQFVSHDYLSLSNWTSKTPFNDVVNNEKCSYSEHHMIRRAISHEGIIYQMQSRLALGWEMQDRRLWIAYKKLIWSQREDKEIKMRRKTSVLIQLIFGVIVKGVTVYVSGWISNV